MSGKRVAAPDCPVDRVVYGDRPCKGPATYYCDDSCDRVFDRWQAGDETNAETLARRFHETYEQLAPTFGYATRTDSRKPWEDVPLRNRRLMIAVAQELIGRGYATPDGSR